MIKKLVTEELYQTKKQKQIIAVFTNKLNAEIDRSNASEHD